MADTEARILGPDKLLFVQGESLVLCFGKEILPELQYLLERALNTLDPQKAPAWAISLSDYLHQHLGERS